MNKVALCKLIDFGKSYFLTRGFSENAAQTIAESGVMAQAFGLATHGLNQWFYIHGCLQQGSIDPGAEVDVLRDRGAIVHLTGAGVPGQLVMRRAVDLVVAKARHHGVAMAAVKKTHWIGALGPYLIPVAEGGYMAQAWAQSSGCVDCAPIGGIDAIFSTNPLAMAVPTGGVPMIADFSTAVMAMGKVAQLIKQGVRNDQPAFMDSDGRLSDDPRVVPEGGSILFTGAPGYGHKGYALSLWSEALTAMAGGDCNNPDLPQSQSFNLTVMDPDAFGGRERFMAEMQRLIKRIKNVRRLPGVDVVRLPGERGFDCLAQARAEGLCLDDFMVVKLAELAAESGLNTVC